MRLFQGRTLVHSNSWARLIPGYHSRSMTINDPTNGNTPTAFGYQFYYPSGSIPVGGWPVITTLHGSGEDGTNNTSQIAVGVGPHLAAIEERAIIIFPQLPGGGSTNQQIDLHELITITALNQTLAEVVANTSRLYLTGNSAGAISQWGVLYRNRTTFAALATASGRNSPIITTRNVISDQATSDADLATIFAGFPIMLLHGDADTTVTYNIDAATALAFGMATVGSIGATPPTQQFVKYTGLDHQQGWDTAFADVHLWDWMLSHSLLGSTTTTTTVAGTTTTTTTVSGPTTTTTTIPPDANIDINPARGVTNAGFAGGRIPLFNITTQWRTNFNAALSANDPAALDTQVAANATGTGSERYGDFGGYCYTMYQATGNSTYATKGIAKLTSGLAYDVKGTNDGNNVRSNFHVFCIMYDGFYAAMNSTQRTNLMNALYVYGEYCVNENVGGNPYVGGFRLGDSDANTTYYLGLALLEILSLSVPEGTRTGWLAKPLTVTAGGTGTVGGINATSSDMNSTARNCLKFYITTNAAGGFWFESSEYNPETVGYLVRGMAAIQSALLTDHFPEFTAWVASAGTALVNSMNDLTTIVTPFKAGDDEQEGGWRPFYLYETIANIAGWLLRVGNGTASLLNKFAHDLWPQATGWGLYGSAFWSGYNPQAAKDSDYTALPVEQSGYFGYRIVQLTSRIRANLFAALQCNVDHAVTHTLYSLVAVDGEFVIDQPTAYLDTPFPGCASGLAFCGMDGMATRTLVRDEGSAAAGWVARTAETHGSFFGSNFYEPFRPAVFVTAAESREVLMTEAGWVVRVTRDATTVLNPTILANYSHYNAGTDWRIQMDAAVARNERVARIFHHPVAATNIVGGFRWNTAGGRDVRVYTAVGVNSVVEYNETTNEALVFGGTGLVAASQMKWQRRCIPVVQDAQTIMVIVEMAEITPGTGSAPLISNASTSAITVGSKVVTFNPTSITVT